ncbi:Insulin-induced protein 2 protein [Pitangus sulphuratus]|nr:Insulin-induced protein 2 protein [Pitangus sulphuratus]
MEAVGKPDPSAQHLLEVMECHEFLAIPSGSVTGHQSEEIGTCPSPGGITSPAQKVDFANNIQLSLTLAALSIGLWWTFDRSRSGFGLGVGIAFLATLVSQLLVYNGVYQYTSPDFLYVRSWLPCIFFAGGITMGNIGRQLAMYECKVIAEKSHED